MKVLLYDTGDVRNELNEPIGVELLAAQALHRLGDRIRIDIKWHSFDDYDFDPLDYTIIGVSIHINCLPIFDHIYHKCRSLGFKGLIVAGNSVATFGYKELLAAYPDVICSIGEGEETIPDIIENYISGFFDPSSIPNVAFLKDGKLIETERTVFNLNCYLPPVRPFLEQIRIHGGICRVEASRGCAWNRCTFCGVAHKYNHVGWRPVDLNIIQKQLIQLSEAEIQTIYFCDEDFIGDDPQRFQNLVRQIHCDVRSGEISPRVKYFISLKPSDFLAEENIQTLREFSQCGLKEVFVGLESGCERQINRYRKCTNININVLVLKKIRELKQLGISFDIGFIFFDYKMTTTDISDNLLFIEKYKLYQFPSSLIKPMRIQPFTEYFEEAGWEGDRKMSLDELYYEYHFADSIVDQIYEEYTELCLEEIAHKLQSFYRRDLSDVNRRKISEKNLKVLRHLEFVAVKTISEYYIDDNMSMEVLYDKLALIKENALALLGK